MSGVRPRPQRPSARCRSTLRSSRRFWTRRSHRRNGPMAEIRVPTLGESVTEATIGKWFKKAGDVVAVDEPLVELETDKVTIEVPAPAAGVLADIAVKDGDTVAVGTVLGSIKEGAGAVPTGRPEQKIEAAKPIGAGPEPIAPRQASPPAPAAAPAKAADAPLAPS